ncbi:MAG: hypothetical protein ACQERC_13525 [Bacteroidota bacterium]
MKSIKTEEAERIFNAARDAGDADVNKATIFYSKSVLEHRVGLLSENFPNNALHAVAIKTCNHPDVLQHLIESGYGLEAASIEEVKLAIAAGADPGKIVFDSPVKTRAEIDYCLKEFPGMYINANSLDELKRYPLEHTCRLGLRINPLVESDTEAIFDVANSSSKFGVPIAIRDQIIEACLENPSITVIHFHIGSRISNFDANVSAAEKIVRLANEINSRRDETGIAQKINTIDIGGGIDFELDEGPHSVGAYCKALEQVDNLFKDFKIITEFGAFVHRDCSFVVSKIEYVINNGEEVPEIAYLHVGADLFLRKVYANTGIEYPCSVLRKSTDQSRGRYNIVGPLCFSGDILFENVELPRLEAGDYFFIYNIGANTLSMWSSHCSREKPKFLLV